MDLLCNRNALVTLVNTGSSCSLCWTARLSLGRRLPVVFHSDNVRGLAAPACLSGGQLAVLAKGHRGDGIINDGEPVQSGGR